MLVVEIRGFVGALPRHRTERSGLRCEDHIEVGGPLMDIQQWEHPIV